MFNKIPLRIRLTISTVTLLTICCVGLTLILNISANRMATRIDAVALTPAMSTRNTIMPAAPVESQAISTLATTEAKDNFRLESLVYLTLIIVSGGILTYYFSGKALKPLDELTSQVKKMHVHNLSETLPVPETQDEVAELTLQFNQMTDKLNQTFLAQQQFASSAAHELKTPLAVLQTKIDVFHKKEARTVDEYKELVNVIEKQTSRLRSLVASLLSMTNMEDIVEKEEVPLSLLLEEIFNELTPLMREKNLTFELLCNTTTLLGNSDLFYRAFYNLIENSIKYNLDGGKIEVVITEEDTEQVIIRVTDTGIGIPDKAKDKIFEPFYRVDKSRSRQLGGTGLGLATVQQIIRKYDGDISVSDHSPQGTCFTIRLKK